MPSLENKWYRRFVFMTVYLVESIIVLTTLSLFPLLISDLGLDPAVYGIFGSISMLPMVFKFFIGPISDRFPIPFLRGRRRGYIIFGALLNAICIPFLAVNPTILFFLFFFIWFLQTLGVAVMDVLVDAMAVGSSKDIQNVKGRTGASAWMFLGTFLGGLFVLPFVTVFDTHTMNPSAPIDMTLLTILGALSIVALIPLILILFLKEEEEKPSQNIREDLKRNLKHPFVKMGIIFAILLNIDAGLTELTLEPFVQSLGYTSKSEVIASLWLISMLGVIVAFLGYKFIDKVRKPRLLMIINAIYVIPSIAIGGLILSGTLTKEIFLILFGVYALISGLSLITFMGMFFDLSDPKAAGTMIALYLTCINLGMVIGIAIGGFLSMGLIYIIIAIICTVRILPLSRIKMEDVEKTFYTEEGVE